MRASKSSLALVAAAFLALPAAANAGLVLRSAGPSAKAYPPGKSVADSASIQLQPGDIVTVLVSNATRVLRGPGAFKLGAATKVAAAFNARGRFGAMRAGEIPSSPSLWHVDVSQSGTVCVSPDVGVKLWRPEKDGAVTLAIATPAGTTEKVEWADGKDELAWPAAVPLADGEYRLSWTGNDDPTKVKFARLSAVPDDPAGLASALIEKGCQSQLDLFIDNAPTEAP
ncbi:hypothetical protein E2493_19035 [Sphingomonas parva]|uniref:Uncharacterized protein n=1 Tax=Sphingomonas parva TaxID=2555898 RepID=A0A4Y8ZMG3_9SPHN|nr:hypothetical protein [Sphingomonas parva]TFI56647.1 hypothetical protein E2493_19035 [Sphingomonas parva]